MRKLRIALVTDKYLPIFGGLEIMLRELALRLTERGHAVRIITATPGVAEDGDAFAVSRLDLPRILYRARTAQALTLVERELGAGNFDVVHSHCVFSPLAHVATHTARRLGIPSVFTLHSDLGGAGGVAMRALHTLLGWGRWPTVLTAVSRYVATQLGALTRRADVELLPNAAALDRWTNHVDDGARPLRIAAAMRFTRRKRPAELVRLMPALLRRLPPAKRPTLTIIGDGPEMPRVRRTVDRLGLASHVELPGYVDHAALPAVLAHSAIFVVPSRREALSIAAIEARAAGLPVVARVPSGVSEVVTHGRHGLLARSDAEIVDALATLCADPALRLRLAAHARRDLDGFAWSRSIARHEQIYALALERGAR